MVLGVTFLTVCLLYIAAGHGLAACHARSAALRGSLQRRRSFGDSLTRRFQQWCQRKKMGDTNNLGAVAFIGRRLYAIAVVFAVYLKYRQV
jgi:hypothetical protein